MKRVWIVENAVPMQALGYIPPTISNDGVRYLLGEHGDAWEEPAVKELCKSLSDGPFELTVVLSPENLIKLLQSGAQPPHVVIFDWQGPGFGDEANMGAIRCVLESSFSFVQVYTHLGVAAVQPKIQELTEQFADRMLPAKAKQDVNASDLVAVIEGAWNDTIAGAFADGVRAETRKSVERVLLDLCSVKRTGLAALLGALDQGFDTLFMAKLRDEIGGQRIDQLHEMVEGDLQVDATDDLRRFQSVVYYYFPADDLVRTGDIVIGEDDAYAMVFSPQCHLERFRKKTGGRLTLIDAVELTVDGIAALRSSGVNLSKVGGSAIANHDGAGNSVVVLPNVPRRRDSRQSLVDIAIRAHAWTTHLIDEQTEGPLRYGDMPHVERLCTITEACCGAIVSRIAGVMASAGLPDFPDFEKARINAILRPPADVG